MVLQKGQSGDLVKRLQAALGIEADGIFGPATELAVVTYQRSKRLAPDGKAGPRTLEALGLALQRQPRPMGERVAWARAVLARKWPIRYGMGKGGTDPDADCPAETVTHRNADDTVDTFLAMDCSGWASACIGLPREHHYGAYEWIETTRIYGDATGGQALFRKIDKPVPGCLAVYPDRDGNEGHVGMVTAVSATGAVKGIDCSSSRKGLSERDFGFFTKRGIWVALVGDPV